MNSEVAIIHLVASLKLVSELVTLIVLSVCLFISLLCFEQCIKLGYYNHMQKIIQTGSQQTTD